MHQIQRWASVSCLYRTEESVTTSWQHLRLYSLSHSLTHSLTLTTVSHTFFIFATLHSALYALRCNHEIPIFVLSVVELGIIYSTQLTIDQCNWMLPMHTSSKRMARKNIYWRFEIRSQHRYRKCEFLVSCFVHCDIYYFSDNLFDKFCFLHGLWYEYCQVSNERMQTALKHIWLYHLWRPAERRMLQGIG